MADDILRDTFIRGLRNAHAVEHEALALMDRQIERMKSYPEVEAMLRQHRTETEEQITRLDAILAECGDSASSVKDLGGSIGGTLAALGHTVAGDEILKNSFANAAFETFEASAYISLISLAELQVQDSAVGLLRTSLEEEQRMAQWVQESIPAITRKFVELKRAGETASH